MNDDEVRYDDDEYQHIIIKHGLRSSTDDSTSLAFELSDEACDLVQEMLGAAARGWSIFRIRRQMRMAIDMLIDAERLTSKLILE